MTKLLIPDHILRETERALRAAGSRRRPHESVVYWAGRTSGEDDLVCAVVVPDAKTTPYNFSVSAKANARAIIWMASHHLEVVAQVHTHPGDIVSHSDWDDDHAFMRFDGIWSVVIPHYARKGILPSTGWGVHRCEQGGFRELDVPEIAASLKVIPSVGDLSA